MTNKVILGFGLYTNEEQTKVDYQKPLVRNDSNAERIDDFLEKSVDHTTYVDGNAIIPLNEYNIPDLIKVYEGHNKTIGFLTKIEDIKESAFICIRRDDATPNGVEEAELEFEAQKLS
jgi:hypothetical protein